MWIRPITALTILFILLSLIPVPAYAEHEYKLVNVTTITVYPNFTKAQWDWINQHYRDPYIYNILDQNGWVWVVGMGNYPRPTNVTIYEYHGSYCSIWQGSASQPPITLNGQISGLAGLTVNWVILNNTGSYHWNYYWNMSEINLFYGWLAPGSTPTCSNNMPNLIYGGQIPIDKNSWAYYTSLGPAFAYSEQLPQAGNYTFVWGIWGKWYNWSSGTFTDYKFIVYYNDIEIIQPTSEPPRNPVARAFYTVGKWIGSTLSRVFEKVGEYIVRGLKAVVPDKLEQFLSDLWNILDNVADVFFKLASNFNDSILPFIQLFVYLIPLIPFVIVAYDPVKVVGFFKFVLEIVLRVVSFIRSLLPF